MLGTTVSHYRVVGKLGEGGMGVVWAAEDETLGRTVALKFCSAAGDPRSRRLLLAEAKAASALVHPNIAQIYEFGETEQGEPFIAMELVNGQSLLQALHDGPLPVARAVSVVRDVAHALAVAHEHGIIHRDIKPSNIRINERGLVKVVDFGLAIPTGPGGEDGSSATRSIEGSARGTPAYMSPEQARGQAVDARSDLFSLGAVLYHALTGSSPFAAATPMDAMTRVIGLNPPAPSRLNPEVGSDLDRVTLKLLAKSPENRYQSANELLEDLEQPTTAQVPRISVTARRRMWVALLVVVLAVAAAVVAYLNRPFYKPSQEAARFYQAGLQALGDGTYFQATKAFERAVKIDKDFAMAHARLAEAWDELEYSGRARGELLNAMPGGMAPRLSRRDTLQLRAIHATVAGDYPAAVAIYRQLAHDAKGAERAQALIDLGRILERTQKTKEALEAYAEATRADRESGAAFLRLGTLYVRQRKAADADRALTAAETIYTATSNNEGLTECAYQRAFMANPEHALAMLRDAAASARRAGNDPALVKILQRISFNLRQMGHEDEALKTAREAYDVADRVGVKSFEARVLIDIGTIRYLDGGQEDLERALKIATDIEAKAIEVRAEANLASILSDKGQPGRTIEMASRALDFYRTNMYTDSAVKMATLIARGYEDKGEFDRAMSYYEQAAGIAASAGRSDFVGLTEEGKASVLRSREKLPQALDAFRKVEESYAASGMSEGVASAMSARAGLKGRMGRLADAHEILRSAQIRFQGLDSANIRQFIESTATSIDINEGRYAEALQRLKSQVTRGVIDRISNEIDACSAEVRSGRAKQAYETSQALLKSFGQIENAGLRTSADLVAAEAEIATGRKTEAIERLKAALPAIEKSERWESAWRAWALIAVAGGEGTARDNATQDFRRFVSGWTAEDVRAYRQRADLRDVIKAVNFS